MTQVFLEELIREITEQVISEEVPLVTGGDINPLVGTLEKAKKKLRATTEDERSLAKQEKQIDALISKLLLKRKGRATLNRNDMEKLDFWTRWMVYLPFGRSYRKGLAKYLRSKSDRPKKVDPFRDFRRYNYDDYLPVIENLMSDNPSGNIVEAEDDENTVGSQAFYHGSSLSNLKPGDLVLPPSKTGKMSEKGRLQNLDKVFFTRDIRSAKIYADRAVHSFGSGIATVYEIEPQGPVNTLNDTPGTTVFSAPYAKVVNKINPKHYTKKKKK